MQTLPYVSIIVRNPESYVDNLLEWSIQGPSSLVLQNPQAMETETAEYTSVVGEKL